MITKERLEELIKNKEPFLWKLCGEMRIVRTNDICNIIKNGYDVYKDDIFEIHNDRYGEIYKRKVDV